MRAPPVVWISTGSLDQRLGVRGGLPGGLLAAERRDRARARRSSWITSASSATAASAAPGSAVGHLGRVDPDAVHAGDDVEGAVDELDGGLGGRRAVVALERDDRGGHLLGVHLEPQRAPRAS